MDDEDVTAEEVAMFVAAGGHTLVDNSTGHGRNPDALVRLSRRAGLNVVMGSGWSLAHGTADPWADEDPEAFAADLVREHRDGVELADGTRIHPGMIGEIGVGPSFTKSERMTLIASAIAQQQVGVPLLIHLPGWQRRGHEVLDIVLGLGADPGSVVLCHMDPSGKDTAYQREIAARGVWLEFDMIGMPNNFPGEGQSPSVQDTVDAVSGLVADGLTGQVLLSQDMFLKNMWTRFGGNGYAFVLTAFLPRIIEAGVPEQTARGLLTANPATVFTNAARDAKHLP
jgi:phosphotriesterase-related protein